MNTLIFKTSTGMDAVAQNIVEGLVADFVSRGGKVRRFERGDSGSYAAVQSYLLAKGLKLTCVKARYIIRPVDAKPKPGRNPTLTWSQVVKYVDGLRAGEGLEPLRAAA